MSWLTIIILSIILGTLLVLVGSCLVTLYSLITRVSIMFETLGIAVGVIKDLDIRIKDLEKKNDTN